MSTLYMKFEYERQILNTIFKAKFRTRIIDLQCMTWRRKKHLHKGYLSCRRREAEGSFQRLD